MFGLASTLLHTRSGDKDAITLDDEISVPRIADMSLALRAGSDTHGAFVIQNLQTFLAKHFLSLNLHFKAGGFG